MIRFRASLNLPHALLSIALVCAICGCATPRQERLAEIAERATMAKAAIKPGNKPSEPLTLDEAIRRAMACSQDSILARSAVDIAIEETKAAGDRTDPAFALNYSEDDADTTSTRWDYDYLSSTQDLSTATRGGDSITASIRLYPQNPFERHHRISAAKQNSMAARYDAQRSEWDIAYEIKCLFAELDYLEKDMRLTEELVTIYRDAVKSTKDMSRAGQATLPDLMTSSRRYLSVLADRNKAQRNLDSVRGTLASYVGLPATDLKITLDSGTFPKFDARSLVPHDVASHALENRADIMAMSWRTRAAKSAYSESLSTRCPWFTDLRFSYTVSTSTDNESGTITNLTPGISQTLPLGHDENDGTEWRVDAIINIPVFSWLNHASDVRNAEYRQAKSLEIEKRDRICRDVVNALETLKAVQKSQVNYNAETAPVIFDMQDVIDSLDENAGLQPDQAARIREEMIGTQRLKMEAEFQHRLAVLRFEHVLGVPLKTVIRKTPERAGAAAE